jgi:hypothetical protein
MNTSYIYSKILFINHEAETRTSLKERSLVLSLAVATVIHSLILALFQLKFKLFLERCTLLSNITFSIFSIYILMS